MSTSRPLLTHATVGLASGLLGAFIGASNSTLLATLTASPAETTFPDQRDPSALLRTAAKLANDSGGLCVLSTVSTTDGVSSRMIQPLPVELREATAEANDGGSQGGSTRELAADPETMGGATSRAKQPPSSPAPTLDAKTPDIPSIVFHTTTHSSKYKELTREGRCTLTYISPSALSCVTFSCRATRLGPLEERTLRDSWPLFVSQGGGGIDAAAGHHLPNSQPPLSVLYAGRQTEDFTAWRLVPTSVRVVSVPLRLPVGGFGGGFFGGGGRGARRKLCNDTEPPPPLQSDATVDWAAPEVTRTSSGVWTVTERPRWSPST